MERLVRNYMITSNDATEEVKAIVSEIVYSIKSGQSTLIILVQILGEFLKNEDPTIRAKGTGLLSAVLADCPQEQFTINVLVDFYCERLSDTASVPELLQGIASLIQFNTFNDENALKVAKSIFASVNVQSFQQTSRHYVFQIFDRMLKDHLTALKQMGQDFVVGFIQAMDGEKDPRNLLLAFSLIKLIIHEFDISQRVELLFEVTFCYFPITFKPPPDDPYGITADDLKIALRECLSATPYFAEFAMPLLLEKLTSSSGNAKKDSMETLAACAPVYGANSIVPYLEPLWEYLKDEIINATDDSFENIALETIKNIVATLSSGIIDRMDHLQQFLKTIVTECMENLKEPELKLAKPCGRILMYCAMASDPSFNIVTLATLRVLIQQYKESELATRKKGILDVLRELITASKNLYGSIDKPSQNIDTDFVTPLSNYKYDYMEIFSSALLNQNEYNELRLCGLRGLYEMILLRQFFNDDEIGVILQYFNRAILEETEQEIVDEALKFLANIAKCKSEIVLEVTLPVFLDNLPCNEDEMKIDNIHGTNLMKANFVKTLDALSELAIEPILFEAYVPQILKKLDFASSNFSTAGIDLEYSESLLHSLHSLLLKKTNHSDISRYVDTLVPHLLTKSIGPSLYDKPEVNNTIQSVFCEEKIIKIVAGIISVITKNLNVSEQSIFISHIFEIFVKGNLNLNYLGFSDQEKSLFMTTFNPLSVESSFQQQNLSLLFTAAVGSCRNEVPYPVPNISEFLSNIVRITLYTKNELHQRSLAQLAASILNKWNQENELKQFVETKILGELRNHFTSSSTENEIIRQISLDTFIWLTKALILRTYPLGYECVSQITSQFSDPILGKRASEGFEVLIGESDFLNKASFAVIRILYKQKFFNYCMPILAEGFKMSSDEVKHNYLIALSHLLRNIPKQVLLSELPSLFPLLIHSLSLPDAELKSSTIDTFYIISGDASRIISEHVSSLVPLLLSSTKPDKGNTMQVRISALQCLGILPDHVSFDVLFPFKSKILRELSTALDDKKRLVRKQAVDCRSKWFLFTGPRADN
ncbi:Dos2-interacting transcription regulator of RNA-Pol-II-domain-containing protein [Glomus cerebriforme]|uniref:MMS19 nucleotide excision repair protein n=1 Tax=Glomus cerebriforme TaxID=658196 RepID=A0A397TFW6_9GLOM|nr:Dos2-interacting transcription regulator of RNA-Pol-II-domain-containing protein [Glomus cerebriforme]